MAANNRVCLGCGTSYHNCSTCDTPGWAWSYCTEECWGFSMRAIALLALGDKLAQMLEPQEIYLLKEAIENESHYLDKILEGVELPRE